MDNKTQEVHDRLGDMVMDMDSHPQILPQNMAVSGMMTAEEVSKYGVLAERQRMTSFAGYITASAGLATHTMARIRTIAASLGLEFVPEPPQITGWIFKRHLCYFTVRGRDYDIRSFSNWFNALDA